MDERLRKELERSVAAWAEGQQHEAQMHGELVDLGLLQPSGDPSASALAALGYVGPAVAKFIDLAQESRAADEAASAAEEKCRRASNNLAHSGGSGHEAQSAGWDLDRARMRQDAARVKYNRARNAARTEVRTERMLRLIQVVKETLSEFKCLDGADAHVADRGQNALWELEASIRSSR